MTEVALVVALVVGIALVVAGAWMVYPPAGLIVAGGYLIALPIMYVRGRRAV